MFRKEQDGIAWLEFELLSSFKNLRHGIFLRKGGMSSGAFSSLNVGDRVGDCPVSVRQNRQAIAHNLGCSDFVSAQLEHGNHTAEITSSNPKKVPICDALMTQEKGTGLLITHADCQAAIFYDPINHAIANVHAGWRGSVLNIYKETVLRMRSCYGSRPENLLVGISPSLCPQSAEFVHYQEELPEPFWNYQEKPNFFNFWEISRMQLHACGILPHHLELAEMSTYFNPDECFSYRRDGLTGRHGTLAVLS
jgi:polyphenol oxidase